MIKNTLTAAALVAVLATPAFAQQPASSPGPDAPASNPPSTMPAQSNTQPAGFLQTQGSNEWRGSKLIGATVYGPDNKSIGEINDVIIDGSGKVKAAVVGVGGFLGVGEKNVALPFEALSVVRKPSSGSIDKVTVNYTKEDLQKAPKFAYFETHGSSQTTGSSNGTPTTGTMRK